MSLWILDTDHVSLFLEGNQDVAARIADVIPDLAITIVTVQELYNGWVGRLNNPTEAKNRVRLYTKLWTTVEYLKGVQIINFDEVADRYYETLIRQNRQLGHKRLQNDVKIAAIAFAANATLVTRNSRDFSQIPNLLIENWAI